MARKSIAVFTLSLLTCVSISTSGFSQLAMRGMIYSDGVVKATFKGGKSNQQQALYLYAPKEHITKGDTTLTTKYEVPGRMVKNENYSMRFTDGTVEKIVYVSGAVPQNIVPKQKFRIDIDLTGHPEPDMTLIVFWSMSQSSYRALPLSKIDEIRADAHADFFWNDGSIPDDENAGNSNF